MLYNWLFPLADQIALFNVFKYLTFRSGGAMMTALVISFIIGPSCIRWLKSKQGEGQPIRDDGPETHLETKKGTPTMGGIMVLGSVLVSTLLWADIANQYVWIVLLVMVGFGMIGATDDYMKLTKRNTAGLPGKMKLLLQGVVSLIAVLWMQELTPVEFQTTLALPFVKSMMIDFGWFFLPFALVVIVGASNAVNLTDGLDGLAIGAVMVASACFALIAYLVGNAVFAGYLQLHFVPKVGEIAVFCSALVGAGLGFLWFNAPPAKVFMGDTGSLSFGGAIGTISVITKHELVLAIIGGLFVIEALSVMIQVFSFKLTGKRVFKMAPIHHHFEKLGWSEPTIVVRFWIIAIIFALIGLSTLKLR